MSDDHRYVGARVPRREDARLVTGRARFAGDVRLPGTVHAVVYGARSRTGGWSGATSRRRWPPTGCWTC
ncbi:hypothetical protein [Planomonospora algeriensis]